MFRLSSLLSALLLASPLIAAPLTPKANQLAPSIPLDFPDPSIIKANNAWYAFATNGNGLNVQVATSSNFNAWNTVGKDALPKLPAWVNAANPQVWAPDVIQRVRCARKFYLMFTDQLLTPHRRMAHMYYITVRP
jgi:beta-xylosidase